jgi:mono/diheme cytochrome c family protein
MMTWERSILWAWFASTSFAGAAFAGCSSSTSGGPVDVSDATAQDGSVMEASGMEEASSPVPDASLDAASDGEATEASTDAGADAGASDGAVDAAVEAGASCVPADAGALDDASVGEGFALVNSVNPNCSSCHGNDYSGGVAVNGAVSKNLTPDPGTGLGCWTDGEIATAILYGTTRDGTSLCPAMPRWSTKPVPDAAAGMTPDQAAEIVQYLRSLAPVVKAVPASPCEIPPDAGTDGGRDGGT